jgi:hypothetical protein
MLEQDENDNLDNFTDRVDIVSPLLAQFRAKSVGDLFAVSGSICLSNQKERVLSLYLFPLSCKLCTGRHKEPTGNALISPNR